MLEEVHYFIGTKLVCAKLKGNYPFAFKRNGYSFAYWPGLDSAAC
jgi:hypothetical protein